MMVVGCSDVEITAEQPYQQHDAATDTGHGKCTVQRAHSFIQPPQQEECQQDEDQHVCKEQYGVKEFFHDKKEGRIDIQPG